MSVDGVVELTAPASAMRLPALPVIGSRGGCFAGKCLAGKCLAGKCFAGKCLAKDNRPCRKRLHGIHVFLARHA